MSLIHEPSMNSGRVISLKFNSLMQNCLRKADSLKESRKTPRIRPHSLVRSLIGHSSSNASLGDYLRLNGYPRLIELFLDQKIKPDDLDTACLAWEDALKFDKSLSTIPFPGK